MSKCKCKKKVIIIQGGIINSVPNVILSEVDRKEIADAIKKVRSVKVKKESYFSGFVTKE